MMNRRCLLEALAALAASSTGLGCRCNTGVFSNREPVLRMPFPAGAVVLCQQGNASPEGRTHSRFNSLHALDFSNNSVAELPVVCAATGRVAFVYSDSREDDFDAGEGFGNQVKVDHGNRYWTYYAHLDSVKVEVGDVLESGQRIGTVGATGAAGNRHLHFSLHNATTQGLGAPATIRMRGIVSADISIGGSFDLRSGKDFEAGSDEIWSGHLYGSENGSNPPLFGAPPKMLAHDLASSLEVLNNEVAARAELAAIGRRWGKMGPESARQRLQAVLDRVPQHEVAGLWWAAMVAIPQGDWADAEARLSGILSMSHHSRKWEAWLAPWAHYFLGIAAKAQSNSEVARAHWLTAIRTTEEKRLRQLAMRELDEFERGSGFH